MNCFSSSVTQKNYSPIALYMKPAEETQVATEFSMVIPLYNVDRTVGRCPYHVKASSQSLERLEDMFQFSSHLVQI